MKKKLISLTLSAAVFFSAGVMAFADTATGTDTSSTPVKLSLADAVKLMQTEGIQAQTAEINRQSYKATADSYSEQATSIKESLDFLSNWDESQYGSSIAIASQLEASGATAVNQKIVKIRRDFAKENIETNYQAEMNAIERNTVQLYYGVLQAQDNVKAAQDNLAIQNTILNNVKTKYTAGVAAKVDVLSAETSVVSAKNTLKEAEVTLNNAKMNLNMLLGYPLTQEVILTDSLVEIEAPDVTLDTAIQNAVANRLDIKLANMGVEVQQILLDNLKYTTSQASSTYKKQQVAYMQAQQASVNAPINVEMDIRNQFNALEQKKMAVESAKATADFAAEGYRLALISYNAGVNTLSDVQEAQLQAFRATQGVAAAVTEYDLAVYDFKYAQGVGTKAITL